VVGDGGTSSSSGASRYWKVTTASAEVNRPAQDLRIGLSDYSRFQTSDAERPFFRRRGRLNPAGSRDRCASAEAFGHSMRRRARSRADVAGQHSEKRAAAAVSSYSRLRLAEIDLVARTERPREVHSFACLQPIERRRPVRTRPHLARGFDNPCSKHPRAKGRSGFPFRISMGDSSSSGRIGKPSLSHCR
jgi:hypothetical protein